MKQPKKYSVRKTYKERESIVTGTVEELVNYFGYTLEIGHSHKPSINRKPTTIKSFMSNLEKAFDVKEGACYNRTSIELLPEVVKEK